MACNDQVGEGDTVTGGEQGVVADNERVDELLPLEILARLAERCALRRSLREREYVVVAAGCRSPWPQTPLWPSHPRGGARPFS